MIGDLHLGSESMFERIYSKDFKTIEDYHEALVRNVNKKVHKKDVLLFLGDLGYREHFEIIERMNGYKILIMGNHDTYSTDTYYKYFDEVYNHPLFITPRMVFSHIPIPVEEGVLNIHGHTHKIDLRSKNHFNLCPENLGYIPYTIKQFTRLLNDLKKPSYKFLEEWYKDIQVTKDKREDLVLDETGLILVKESKKLREKLKQVEIEKSKRNGSFYNF